MANDTDLRTTREQDLPVSLPLLASMSPIVDLVPV